jgi:hypothetical protein
MDECCIYTHAVPRQIMRMQSLCLQDEGGCAAMYICDILGPELMVEEILFPGIKKT